MSHSSSRGLLPDPRGARSDSLSSTEDDDIDYALLKRDPSTLTPAEKKERRKQQVRVNLRRFRQRKKVKESETEKEVLALRERVQEQTVLNSGLRRSLLSALSGTIGYHGSIMQDYANLFRFGTASGAPITEQNALMKYHFSSNFHLQSPDHPIGYQYLQLQWARYTKLFPKIRCRLKSVTSITPDGDVVRVIIECHLPLTRAGLSALFPGALENEEIAQALVGKTLSYDLVQTGFFDADHKIEFMTTYYDFVKAWQSLVKNAEKTLQVVSTSKLADTLIDIEDDVLDDVITREANALVSGVETLAIEQERTQAPVVPKDAESDLKTESIPVRAPRQESTQASVPECSKLGVSYLCA